MKLAVCVQTDEVPVVVPVALLEGSFAEKVDKASHLGFDGVELMTIDPTSLDVEAIRFQTEGAGLEVAAIGTGALAFALGLTLLNQDPGSAREAQIRLRSLIDFAARLRVPVVTIGSFRGRLAWGGASALATLTEALGAAATYAAEHGVRLALEPLNRYEADFVTTVHEGLTFVQSVRLPALGLLLDTYHVNLEESSWTEPFKQVLAAGLLWHIHIGDNNRLAPGKGLIDFAAIIETLRGNGYEGYLSAELFAKPDPDGAARETIGYLRTLLEA